MSQVPTGDAGFTIETIGGDAAWCAAVSRFGAANLFMAPLWAKYKARGGWGIHRFDARSAGDGPSAAVAQVQVRRPGAIGPPLALIQGGPLYAPECGEADVAQILTAFLAAAGAGGLGMQVVQPGPAVFPALESALDRLGFKVIVAPDSGTLVLDVAVPEDQLRGGLSKNWRHNLTRAEKRDLEVRWVANTAEARRAAFFRIDSLYDALTERKSFAKALDPLALGECAADDPAVEIVEVYAGDELAASRVIYHGGKITLDLLAASGEAARKTYANYLALWTVIRRARERGAERFDCGGIDPENNPGVYNFKKGLGGEEAGWGRLWVRTRPGFLWPLAARKIRG